MTAIQSLVIVGNGMATGRLLDELLTQNRQTYRITVIGDEPHGSYNRIMLSSVLASDVSVSDIIQKDSTWYNAHNIAFYPNQRVTAICRKSHSLTCENGQTFKYDKLVIATGSRAAKIPAANQSLEGIFSFRTIADTESMIARAASAKKTVVIGGGLLGLEAAYGLAKRGIRVSLIHRSQWLLNRQLDATAGKLLQRDMAQLGIDFYLGDQVTAFLGQTGVTGVELASGKTIEANLAVIATGITPNAELGLEAGLEGQRAIAVDDYMTTSDKAISALGECIEHRGDTFGLVAPIWEQAKALASQLISAHQHSAIPYAFFNTPVATKLKVSGIQVFSAGQVQQTPQQQVLTINDPQQGVYRKIIIENNTIKGIVLFGDVTSGNFYFDLMQHHVDVSAAIPEMIFGEAYIDNLALKTATQRTPHKEEVAEPC